MIELSASIEVEADPSTVASTMFDPQRSVDWMSAVSRVEVLDAGLASGARVKHYGTLMGRSIEWTTEVEAVHFPHILSFRIADGPFVGTLRYGIQRSGAGSRVEIRSSGELKGFDAVPDAMVVGPMRATLQADLEKLKAILETNR